jgi:hypothetical protein
VCRYQYTDYNNVGGVILGNTKSDFLNALHRFTTESEFFAEISARQLSDADRCGRVDGKSGERLIQLFDGLVGKRTGEMHNGG